MVLAFARTPQLFFISFLWMIGFYFSRLMKKRRKWWNILWWITSWCSGRLLVFLSLRFFYSSNVEHTVRQTITNILVVEQRWVRANILTCHMWWERERNLPLYHRHNLAKKLILCIERIYLRLSEKWWCGFTIPLIGEPWLVNNMSIYISIKSDHCTPPTCNG